MRLFEAALIGCLIVACQGNQLTPGTVRTADLAPSPSAETQSASKTIGTQPKIETKPSKTINTNKLPVPDFATMPVPVAGANLVCTDSQALPLSLSCSATDSAGQPLNFEPEKAFYSVQGTTVWSETSFSQTAVGGWSVVIPDAINKTPLNVLLIDGGANYVTAQKTAMVPTGLNLVPDGSFENQKINPAAIDLTRILLPPAQLTWKAHVPADQILCHPVVELSSNISDQGGSPAAGSQWVQLTAPCSVFVPERTTMGISQTLKLVPGRQYLVGFSYKSPLGEYDETVLQFSMGGATLFDQPVATPGWTRFQFVYTAVKADTVIDFTENGNAGNHGTAIDDVSVTEMVSQ